MEKITAFLGNEQYAHATILIFLLAIVYLVYTNSCSCNVEHFHNESNLKVSRDSSKLCSENDLNNGIFNYHVNKINRGNRTL